MSKSLQISLQGHFAKCYTKKKDIHSLNQKYSDNTAQDDFKKIFSGDYQFSKLKILAITVI